MIDSKFRNGAAIAAYVVAASERRLSGMVADMARRCLADRLDVAIGAGD